MPSQQERPHQRFELFIVATRKIAAEVAGPHSADVDSKARFPSETVQALRDAGILSAAVPKELGGAGCSLYELAQLCSALSQSCGSSGMVLAMHFIQLGCIARHGRESDFFRSYMRELVEKQYLLASITSEVGTNGDTRSSVCCVEREGDSFFLNKEATWGSYCLYADAILVTCRRQKDSPPSDQVMVLVKRENCELTQTGTWNTMGMRGTCSPGFSLRSSGPVEHIVPGSYADSSAQTMVPYSHILWASLWWGIAADAVGKAATFVRGQARQNPGTVPPAANRLAEASLLLQNMKQHWLAAAQAFDGLAPDATAQEELLSIGWALRMNNLKITCSDAAPQIVHKALQIVGVLAYKNDSPFSLGRQYRDTLSASLMVSNDRIAAKSASMLLVYKDAP